MRHPTASSCLFALGFFSLTTACLAQARVPEPSPALITRMEGSREAYIYRMMQPFRAAAGLDQALTEHDLAKAKTKAAAQSLGWMIGQFRMADVNNDGVLSPDEIPEPDAFGIGRQIELGSMDTDKDGSVSLREVYRSPDAFIPGDGYDLGVGQLSELFALDPNSDGKLTAVELEGLAREAFAYFDTDGDSVITTTELKPLQEKQRSLMEARAFRAQFRNCGLPKAHPADEVVMVSAYETGTLSDVTIVGQDDETQTMELRIEAGEKPLYLVGATYEPTIWRITGHSERVRKFVVSSSSPNAGVVGLPRQAIVFRPRSKCISYISEPTPERVTRQADALKSALDASSIKIISVYELGGASIPSNAVEPASWKRDEGRPNLIGLKVTDLGLNNVDGATYSEFLRYNPWGIVDIDPSNVITNGKAESYDVFPGLAGLLQLIKDGSITVQGKNGNELLVTRPIARLPAGVWVGIAGRKRFVFANGVPVPDGDYRRMGVFRIDNDGNRVRVKPGK